MNIELPAGCRRGLYLGSILPDLLVHTYLRGHTWDTSGEKVLTKLKELEELGILNVWTGIRFGMLLHYLEDFFTMAHSRYFQGNLVEHIRYEVSCRAIFGRFLPGIINCMMVIRIIRRCIRWKICMSVSFHCRRTIKRKSGKQRMRRFVLQRIWNI